MASIFQRNEKGDIQGLIIKSWKLNFLLALKTLTGFYLNVLKILIESTTRWFCHRGPLERGPLHYVRTKWVRSELKTRFGKKKFLENERERSKTSLGLLDFNLDQLGNFQCSFFSYSIDKIIAECK